jgi:hypothetical protein
MSWNNILPWSFYILEANHRAATMYGAFPEEAEAGVFRDDEYY